MWDIVAFSCFAPTYDCLFFFSLVFKLHLPFSVGFSGMFVYKALNLYIIMFYVSQSHNKRNEKCCSVCIIKCY